MSAPDLSDRLEPGAHDPLRPLQDQALVSLAISMKRIADALTPPQLTLPGWGEDIEEAFKAAEVRRNRVTLTGDR